MNLGKAQRFHDSSRSPKHEIPPETTKHQENTTLENVNMMPPHVLWISVRNRNFMITPDPGNTRPHPRQQKESGTPCIMENHELPVIKKTKKNGDWKKFKNKKQKTRDAYRSTEKHRNNKFRGNGGIGVLLTRKNKSKVQHHTRQCERLSLQA